VQEYLLSPWLSQGMMRKLRKHVDLLEAEIAELVSSR
jgi:hypothetical protein